jgi:ferredoxin
MALSSLRKRMDPCAYDDRIVRKDQDVENRTRVKIEASQCQGHARCAAIAPHIFQLDEFGNAFVRGNGFLADADIDQAYMARSNCPEMAIVIEEPAND